MNTRVGVKRCEDATMHVLVNGEDMGVAATDVPRDVFAVVDVYGRVESVGITSTVPTSASEALMARKGKNHSRVRNMHLQSARERVVEPPEIVVAPSDGAVDSDDAASPLGAIAPPIAEGVSEKVCGSRKVCVRSKTDLSPHLKHLTVYLHVPWLQNLQCRYCVSLK